MRDHDQIPRIQGHALATIEPNGSSPVLARKLRAHSTDKRTRRYKTRPPSASPPSGFRKGHPWSPFADARQTFQDPRITHDTAAAIRARMADARTSAALPASP